MLTAEAELIQLMPTFPCSSLSCNCSVESLAHSGLCTLVGLTKAADDTCSNASAI